MAAATAAGAGLLSLLTCAQARADASATFKTQTMTGPLLGHGADGREQTLMCPDGESALGGGYILTPRQGEELGEEPADVRESRPTADADGWIVAVRKSDTPGQGWADLTVYALCTQGANTPGG